MLKNKIKAIFIIFLFILVGFLAANIFSINTEETKQNSMVAKSSSVSIFNPNIFVDLSKKVVSSVVNISIFTRSKNFAPHEDPMLDFFENFFGPGFQGPGGRQIPRGGNRGIPDESESMPTSLGSGFVVDESGLILTNNHVVDGADEIKVYFTEETTIAPLDGEVVGRDPELDLALIKVKTNKKLIALPFGDSDQLQVGEFVVAVGNPFGQGHSVTQGIISAKNRDIPNFLFGRYLQTDAPINPGNSGGPLVNLKGEVIGINNAIDARAQGIGFAIPSNLVKRVLPQLKEEGRVRRGYIGVIADEVTPQLAQQIGLSKEIKGAFVTHITPGDPADKGGMKVYDIITDFNNQPIKSSTDLIRAVTALDVGNTAEVKVIRDGKPRTLNVKVSERPSEESVQKNRMYGNRSQNPNSQKGEFEKMTGMEVSDLNERNLKEYQLPKDIKGVLISNVYRANTPATQAGLSKGDIILEINRKPVSKALELKASLKQGKSYLLKVLRMRLLRSPGGAPIFEPQYVIVVFDLNS